MRAKILIQTFRQMFCFLHGWPFRASGVALTPRCHAHRGVRLYCTYDDLPNIESDFEHSCTARIVSYKFEYRHAFDTALKTFYLSISRSEGVDLHKNRGSNIYGHTLFRDLSSKESILNLYLPF